MVSRESFEHFDAISMVDKGTHHGKLLSICFLQYHSLTVFMSISVEVSQNLE